MIKIKHVLAVAGLALCFTSCKKTESFDEVAQFKTDTAAIRAYVNANKINAVKDKNGIFYVIITPGEGTVTYADRSKVSVTVDYTGTILGKTTPFDTTDGKQPATFILGGLIAGWQLGIPYIQKGGKIRLILPSYYGYGNQYSDDIPANSILDFTIDLKNVVVGL